MNENDLGQGLIKQMNKDYRRKADMNIKFAQEIIAKEKARINHLKWMAKIYWRLVIYYIPLMLFALFVFPANPWGPLFLVMVELIFLVCAIVYTAKVYIASRSVSLQQIQKSLCNIEEQLKKTSACK